MSEFGIYNLYSLIKKNILVIFSIISLLNIYPVYLYINYNYFSQERISSTEIVPVNEINLITLRDFQTKILNAKVLIETGYNDLKISKMQNNEFFVYTPQNLLSLFFDTAISKNSFKKFIKDQNLSGIISENDLSVNYQTSNRIDPFNDIPQKIVTLDLRIPNMEYKHLLPDFVKHVNKLAIIKINEQLDISTNNLTNILQTFKEILETKKRDLLFEKQIELKDKVETLSKRLEYTNLEISSITGNLKINLNNEDLEKYVDILLKFPNSGLVTDSKEIKDINEEITKWIAEFKGIDIEQLGDKDIFRDRDLFNKFAFNKILLKEDIDNVVQIQKLFYLVASYNAMFYEIIDTRNELEIINQKILNPQNTFGIINEFDQNYLTQSTLMQQSLLKEKLTLSKAIEIVNTSYTDIYFRKTQLNFWYFVISNFLVIIILSVYLILFYESQKNRS